MGCWPLGFSHFENETKPRYDSPSEMERMGGHLRNWDLRPAGKPLTLDEGVDIEIRRALRVGIDGFTVDAWAGSQSAKDTLDALFKVAEAKDYPFQITITLDPNSMGTETALSSVKYLLDRHGKSSKLARRDGKPIIFGYQSIWMAISNAEGAYVDNPALQGTWIWDQAAWRCTPRGWDYLGKGMENFEKKVGQPLYLEFCMSAFDYGVKDGHINDDQKVEAAGILAKHVAAVGAFNWMGIKQGEMAKATLRSGAEWMSPVGFGQKENLPWESYGPPDLGWFRGGWETAIGDGSTLLQYITWNDYGENSAMAPAYNTRYALYDLTGYYIDWWKHGKPPVTGRDKLYLVYRKYPQGSKIWPFRGKFPRGEAPLLEVVTNLTRPATIKLPGRNAQYEAPAGMSSKVFPNTPGIVAADLLRDGKLVLHVESPEPITDRPFREDNAYVAYSSEEESNWKADFGDAPMFKYSEYSDDDHDGLPNWYEMYFFGKWMDMSTATLADPKGDPDEDGKTNLEEYLANTDPTRAPLPNEPEEK